MLINSKRLRNMTSELQEVSNRIGIKTNLTKNKIMINSNERPNKSVRNIDIDYVEEYIYTYMKNYKIWEGKQTAEISWMKNQKIPMKLRDLNKRVLPELFHNHGHFHTKKWTN